MPHFLLLLSRSLALAAPPPPQSANKLGINCCCRASLFRKITDWNSSAEALGVDEESISLVSTSLHGYHLSTLGADILISIPK